MMTLKTENDYIEYIDYVITDGPLGTVTVYCTVTNADQILRPKLYPFLLQVRMD